MIAGGGAAPGRWDGDGFGEKCSAEVSSEGGLGLDGRMTPLGAQKMAPPGVWKNPSIGRDGLAMTAGLGRGTEAAGLGPRDWGRGNGDVVTGLKAPVKMYLTPGMPESLLVITQDIFMLASAPVYARNRRVVRDCRVESCRRG